MTFSEQTQSALQKAQSEYRSRLSNRADELHQLWQQASNGSDDAMKELLHQLHRLGGSAGMYELSELGLLAKSTHQSCSQGSASEACQAQMDQLMVMMRDLAIH